MLIIIKYLKVCLIALFLLLLSLNVIAQESQQKPNNSITQSDTSDSIKNNVANVNLEGDIILEEISIEAIIEKPRVSFLPKRIDPEFGELEFIDRSFVQELKKFPDNPMISDKRLFEPKKIENLNRQLKKKKNKIKKELN